MDEKENINVTNLRKLIIVALKTKSTINVNNEYETTRIREIIQEIRKLGIIRNHSLIVSMMKKLVLTGESDFIRIKELETKGPWKWDQLRKQLDILEKNGYITFERDEARNITCSLNLKENNSPFVIKRLLDYYSNYYKKDQFTIENISRIIALRQELFLKQKELKEIKKQFEKETITSISKKELAEFVDKISKAYTFEEPEDFEEPITRLIKILEEQPLFLKGLSIGENELW